MRAAALGALFVAGCLPPKVVTSHEPILLAAVSRPVPDGFDVAEHTPVEVRACEGEDYVGLHALLARAQLDADALVQVTVEREERVGVGAGRPVPLPVCYVLRGYRVVFRPIVE